ncbi:MAG: hypothetical protein Fur0025_16060 [Oscillatoriaceae cyanobacterium]
MIRLHWSFLCSEHKPASIMESSQSSESSPLDVSLETTDTRLASVVNLPRLQHISQGNVPLQMELMRSFVEEVGTGLAKAQGAIEAGNFQTIARFAHQIQGSGSNLGVLFLPELAAQLEVASKQNNLEIVNDVITSLAQVLSQLKAVVAGGESLLPEASEPNQDLLVDWQYLHKISQGNAEFERNLLQTFVEAGANYLAQCQIALSNDDAAALQYQIDKMKDSAQLECV